MDTPLTTRAYNLGLKAVPNFVKVLGEEQIAYYEKHLDELPAAISRGFILPSAEPVVQVEKFALLVDLGIITVPKGYVHDTRLTMFSEKNKKKFYSYDDNITDENFSHPTRILKPGDKLHARVFQQVVSGTTTSEERLAFLATQKAIYTGAQGASLVFDQKRNQLPKGKWYSSFDKPDRLWEDADGNHRVPNVNAHSGGDFDFDLGNFENVWHDNLAFLCFSDE